MVAVVVCVEARVRTVAESPDAVHSANGRWQAQPLGARAAHRRRQAGSVRTLESHLAEYSRNIAADLKPGDVLPWAQALVDERRENLGKGYMNTICVPFGPSYITSADTTGAEQMKIVQTPSLILILNPDLTYRQVYMDGRALETRSQPGVDGLLGRPLGRRHAGRREQRLQRSDLARSRRPSPHRSAAHDRAYRRRDFGHMDLEITYSDPKAYTKPWTVAVRAELAADTEMIEFVCNEREANPGLAHWVGKASDERKAK